MARGKAPRWRPPGWMAPVAALLTIGAITTAAIAAPGYDTQETPRLETGVWVTRDDNQYARVNTQLGEIDTTRAVAQPGGLVQSGARGLLFTQGFVQAWPLDGAHPTDLVSGGQGDSPATSAATNVMATPNGTSHVDSAGPYVLYLTTSGQVYLGTLPDGVSKPANPRQLNPLADAVREQGAEQPRYVADAAAIDADGNVAMYSSAEGGIRRFSTSTGKFVGGITTIPLAPGRGDGLEMAIVNDHWVLFSASAGTMWIEGLDQSVQLDVAGDALLQSGATTGDAVLVADSAGLVEVPLNGSAVTRVATAQGTPAAPIVVDGVAYAAWISTTSASMWSSESPAVKPLEVDAQALQRQLSLSPVFRSNGDRAVLSETVTGLLWTVPDGKLIALSEWNDPKASVPQEGTVQVEDVIEQKPPVAKPDVFGVRPGAVVTLPVLLNDDDPNKKDVLTIDAASMTGLSDPGFGNLSLITQDQQAVVHVSASDGSATFRYAATDGSADSPTTTVTLNVMPNDVNTAPQWCAVEGCTQQWPTPQVAPGGFVSVPVLDGWVDAEGDAVLLIDAKPDDPNAPISVVPTADGHVAIRHLDPNAGEATIPVTVTVADARGLETTKELDVRVTTTPALVVKPVAVSGGVSTPVKVAIADHVAGGSGSYRLVDSTAAQGRGDAFTVSPSSATGTIELEATKPGLYAATYTVEDTANLAQRTAVIRLTVADSTPTLALPPLHVVRAHGRGHDGRCAGGDERDLRPGPHGCERVDERSSAQRQRRRWRDGEGARHLDERITRQAWSSQRHDRGRRGKHGDDTIDGLPVACKPRRRPHRGTRRGVGEGGHASRRARARERCQPAWREDSAPSADPRLGSRGRIGVRLRIERALFGTSSAGCVCAQVLGLPRERPESPRRGDPHRHGAAARLQQGAAAPRSDGPSARRPFGHDPPQAQPHRPGRRPSHSRRRDPTP